MSHLLKVHEPKNPSSSICYYLYANRYTHFTLLKSAVIFKVFQVTDFHHTSGFQNYIFKVINTDKPFSFPTPPPFFSRGVVVKIQYFSPSLCFKKLKNNFGLQYFLSQVFFSFFHDISASTKPEKKLNKEKRF